ncbi:MAG: glycerol-3-phosphate 1-O-acyltransferase PlsY [Candidatus Hydrogenedentales bacterium]
MSLAVVYTALAIVLAYVLGSIPTGLWLGLRFRGIDIREHGSRNIGATNTLRVLGKALGAIALTGDIAKGLVAVLLIGQLSPHAYGPLACGIAAILGHTFSIFLRFRGGKGVATSAGVFLALTPVPMLVAVAVFAIVVVLTGMVSAGSLAGAVVITVLVWAMPVDLVVRVIVTAVAAIIVIRHRANIQRILAGTENRFGPARRSEAEERQ